LTGRAGSKGFWLGVVLAFLLGAVLAHMAFVYKPYTFLIGDCPYYAQTAISLVLDHDLDLTNQLQGGIEPHQRQISLGARGEWYPKHPILMPLLTAPLLPIFKMKSFLVFNVAVLAALAAVLFGLACRAAPPPAAAAGTLLTIFGSFIILYDYNYSPDLFACLLLSGCILLGAQGRNGWAGLAGGLAVFARTSNLFLLPVLAAWIAWKASRPGEADGREGGEVAAGRRGGWRDALKAALVFGIAAAGPILIQAGLNASMFGSPLASPYSRIIMLEEGRIVLHSHVSDFENPLWDGIKGQLMDARKGLVRTAPVLFLAIPGFFLWFRKRRDEALLCFAVGEFLFLLFSRYLYWPTSHVGNRFLIPAVALSAPAVSCFLAWAFGKVLPVGGDGRRALWWTARTHPGTTTDRLDPA